MLKILDSYKNITEWEKTIHELSHLNKTIFLLPQYINAHLNYKSKGKLLFFKEKNLFFFHSFVLNETKIKNTKYKIKDITNPYGYSGSISNIKDRKILKKIFDYYKNYLDKNKILLELSMTCKENSDFSLPFNYKKNYVKKVCFIDIKEKNNSILKSKNQNMVRKALKNKLKIEISFDSKDLENFKKIYSSFLKRKKADKKYSLKKNFSKNAIYLIKKKYLFFIKILNNENKVVSIGLFFIYNGHALYHFSASINNKNNNGAFELMIFQCFKFCQLKKFKSIYLGGGLTSSSDDNLFRFKKKLSDKLENFYIIKKIYNKNLYNEIKKQTKKNNDKKFIFYI